MNPSGFGFGGTYFVTDAGIGASVACARASAGIRATIASIRQRMADGLMDVGGDQGLRRRQEPIDDRLLQLPDALLVPRVDDEASDPARLDEADVEEHLHLLAERRLGASQL